MMTTAQEMVNDAATMAGVKEKGQALPSERNTRYLRYLNQKIDSLENDGIEMNIGTLTAGDTIFVSDADLDTLEHLLSIRISRSARKVVDPDVVREAKRLKDATMSKHVGAICQTLEPAITQKTLGSTTGNIFNDNQ